MGAAAVKWPTSAEVMATHFGISLICLASASLLAFILIDAKNGKEARRDVPPGQERAMRIFRGLVIVTFVFSIVVAYSGAYVRHTESELACTSWPTCTGDIIPDLDLSTPQGIQTMHRVLAGAISLMVLGMAWIALKFRETRRDLWLLALWALVNVILQGFVGRWVVYSGLALMATLAHAALMSTLFVTLAEGIRRTWPVRASRAVTTDSVATASPSPAPGD